jgi:hypothetical protein
LISRIFLTRTGIYLHLRARQAALEIELGGLRQFSHREGQGTTIEIEAFANRLSFFYDLCQSIAEQPANGGQ